MYLLEKNWYCANACPHRVRFHPYVVYKHLNNHSCMFYWMHVSFADMKAIVAGKRWNQSRLPVFYSLQIVLHGRYDPEKSWRHRNSLLNIPTHGGH